MLCDDVAKLLRGVEHCFSEAEDRLDVHRFVGSVGGGI